MAYRLDAVKGTQNSVVKGCRVTCKLQAPPDVASLENFAAWDTNALEPQRDKRLCGCEIKHGLPERLPRQLLSVKSRLEFSR